MGRVREHEQSEESSIDEEVGELETAFGQAQERALDNPEQIEAITPLLLALVAAWVTENVPRIYVGGIEEALAVLNLPLSASEIHDDVADTLSQDLLEALEASVNELERQTGARLREMERSAAAANLGADTQEPPDHFTDRGGKRWDFSRYATMLVRDAVTDIHNTAVGMMAAEIGSPGVRITDGSSSDTDEACKQANGQAWSTSYFLVNTKEHPNCQRRGVPLPTDWQGELDRE